MSQTFKPPIFEIDGVKTLPFYYLRGKTKENIKALSKGKFEVICIPPEYEPKIYGPTELATISSDPKAAVKAVKEWPIHAANFAYYVQFKDDPSRELALALSAHTKLITDICDSRLQIDTTELGIFFLGLIRFEDVHSDYRKDPDREAKFGEYAKELEKVHNEEVASHSHATTQLIERIVRQIELKGPSWQQLPRFHLFETDEQTDMSKKMRLFYSFSHKDDSLQQKLESHLAILKRIGVLEDWHFRRITGGKEWEGQIDEHLEAADIILLLVSAEFIASDYCYDVEMKRAIERHEAGSARVIPISLRPCVWKKAPFERLQGLPKNMKAVTSWSNRDEAWTDVANGIRKVVEEMQALTK